MTRRRYIGPGVGFRYEKRGRLSYRLIPPAGENWYRIPAHGLTFSEAERSNLEK